MRMSIQAGKGAGNSASLSEPIRLHKSLEAQFIFQDSVQKFAISTSISENGNQIVSVDRQ